MTEKMNKTDNVTDASNEAVEASSTFVCEISDI